MEYCSSCQTDVEALIWVSLNSNGDVTEMCKNCSDRRGYAPYPPDPPEMIPVCKLCMHGGSSHPDGGPCNDRMPDGEVGSKPCDCKEFEQLEPICTCNHVYEDHNESGCCGAVSLRGVWITCECRRYEPDQDQPTTPAMVEYRTTKVNLWQAAVATKNRRLNNII